MIDINFLIGCISFLIFNWIDKFSIGASVYASGIRGRRAAAGTTGAAASAATRQG
jgi:hypothetical protein